MTMKFGNYTFNNTKDINISFKSNDVNTVSVPIKDNLLAEKSEDIYIAELTKKKEKKSTRTAIAVGTSVLLLSALITVFNPRYSPKIAAKLKELQLKASREIEKSRGSHLRSNFYKGYKDIMDGVAKTFNAMCNFNSGKDVAFRYLCCENKKNINMKNKTTEKAVKFADRIFVKLFKKPHELITKGFEKISQTTVRGKYKRANKSIDKVDELILQFKESLSPERRKLVEEKMQEIAKRREFFTDKNLNERFVVQDSLMQNVERDFLKDWRSYRYGFDSKFVKNGEHIKKGLNFWAEDALAKKKQVVQNEGKAAVNSLMSSDKGKNGLYDEIYNIVAEDLGKAEASLLKRRVKAARAKLKSASVSECNEYFDKKRDLVLGSAPTDIVSALGGLGLCGLAVGTANSKDERISRLVTTGIPVVLGLATSLVCTALLFSGATGLLVGGAVGLLANKIGNIIDERVLGNVDEEEVELQVEAENV